MTIIFVLFSFGCTSGLTSSISSDLSSSNTIPDKNKIKQLLQKVADWQIKTFEDAGKYRALPHKDNRKPWHHREPYHDLDWTNGALYVGMYQWSLLSEDKHYSQWLYDIGERNQWQLFKRKFHADDHTVGQFYLNLSRQMQREDLLLPTQKSFDDIMASEQAAKYHWHWCDALFMSPPVWAKLGNITGNKKYINYMHGQYLMTYERLWDIKEQLFFRDKSYLNKKEKNGEKLFWARGNGWVFGGLALLIPELPDDWEHKAFYIKLFQQIAQTIKKEQRTDGTWSAGVLGDEKDYPNIETSGSAFFTFGLAWGINNGLLDNSEYQVTLIKAWQALAGAVNEDGMLGYVQPVGAAPGESYKNYTEVYGIGAFLAAGSEMYKYLQKAH